MCELFGLTGPDEIVVNEYLETFAGHSVNHPNGWGLAIFCGKEVNIEYIDMPEHLKDRYQYYTKAEMGKFQQTGYTGTIMSLESAIYDYVVNYLLPGKYLGD